MKRLSKILVTALLLTTVLSACGHTHDFGDWAVVKEPTCSEEGATERTCSCGEKETAPIPTLEHAFSEQIVAKEATCNAEGILVQTCAVCNEAVTTAIPAGEHRYTETITKQATCVEAGEKTLTCTVCGHTETEAVLQGAHAYVDNITKKATCQQTGEKTQVCAICNDTVTATIPLAEHSWKSASCTSPSTCAVCGITSGSVGGHVYSAATCKAPKTCMVCGATSGSALGHNYGSSGTCKTCGEMKPNSFKIELPALPAAFSWYMYDGNRYTAGEITNITYTTEYNHDGTIRANIYFSGKKTYNYPGENNYAVQGDWALIEKSTGLVGATGTVYQKGLQVGGTFKNVREYAGLVGPGLKDTTYVLEIYDH